MINLVTGFLELLVQLPSFHPKAMPSKETKGINETTIPLVRTG